jgi:hypothetical protein
MGRFQNRQIVGYCTQVPFARFSDVYEIVTKPGNKIKKKGEEDEKWSI